ncbi:MAG: GNAT family N-acetyltransferase [Anaerolineaceae bacterium]|nr:GNAT family N-acetyltransferase [Anaerolineaceae bacterium]
MEIFNLRDIVAKDQEWIRPWIIFQWGAEYVIAHDTKYVPVDLPGVVAVDTNGENIGLITYQIMDQECELITLNSLREGIGVGTALIEAVKHRAIQEGCKRIWLVTTNDNLNAVRFYQKRGFHLVRIHRNSVTRARKQKPEIPEIGDFGIPIRDEIELEFVFD